MARSFQVLEKKASLKRLKEGATQGLRATRRFSDDHHAGVSLGVASGNKIDQRHLYRRT
jgi:hypothetical protein